MFKGKFIDIVSEKDGFLRGPFGSALKKSLFVPKSIDTYKVYEQGVVLEQNHSIGRYYISKEYFDEKMSRFEVKPGDFLVSCSGVNYGAIYQLPPESEKGVINQALLRIRLNYEMVDENYFYYYFKAYIAKAITGGTGDSTIPNFPPMDYVKNIDIELPPIDEQKRIGKLLGEIDLKIMTNNRINRVLESMSKTIYDYWFMQFEYHDENDMEFKKSCDTMKWSKEVNRSIPSNSQVEPLSFFIKNSKNGDWGSECPDNPDDIRINCFRGADFPSITEDYMMSAPVRYIKKQNSDRLLAAGDLVTEISGGSPTQSTGRIGYINDCFLTRSENDMTCSNFCKAFTPISRRYQFWLYQTWKMYYDNGAMFNFESKTTGIKNLMFDDFIDSVFVVSPDERAVEKYQEMCEEYYSAIQKNLRQNQELARLRDFLLPQLINGQVVLEK